MSRQGTVTILSLVSLWCAGYFILEFLASPRARLNFCQVIAIAALMAIISRKREAGNSTPAINSKGSRSVGLWIGLTCSILLYSSVLDLSFLGDDFAHIYTLSHDGWHALWQSFARGQAGTFYRPLGFASLSLDHAVWRQNPFGYHLTNLILHLSTIVGLWALCYYVSRNESLAGRAAMIFAVIPIQVEAITWISARFDLLATSLIIWACVLYVRFRLTGETFSYCGALVLSFAAVLCKESAFVLPLLLALIESLVLPLRNFRYVAALAVAGMATFLARFCILGGVGGYPGSLSIGMHTFLGLFLRTPTQLLLGFNWLESPEGLLLAIASCTAAVILTVALWAHLREKRRLILFSLAWMVVAALPAHTLLLIGPGLTNSRVLYLSSAGAALLIASLLESIRFDQIRSWCTILLVLCLGLGVWRNLDAWRRASRLSNDVRAQLLAAVPAPLRGTTLVGVNLPDTVNGVFFFNVGFGEAVKLAYGREDLAATRTPPSASSDGPKLWLYWNEKTGLRVINSSQ